jgi:multiple sugar transport system ATP-binding protein
MAGVILEHVSRVFPGNVIAVNRLSLAVADGELLVIVGPSGCGKTTTLRLIAGLEEATEGTIRIGDRLATALAPRDRNIAMVFQNYALYPHMNVYRNMAFGLELREWGRLAQWACRLVWPAKGAELEARRQSIDQRVRQTARLLGIEHLLDRLPRQLSGGERQRVALGRAMVRQPAAFLFDEPLSNLDAQLRVEMRRELKQLHRRLATTMIYVTHDQVEALTLGDRIAVMNRGEIQQVGTPEGVYREPANLFVAGFLGTPPMNFWPGRLECQEGHVCFVGGKWRVGIDKSRQKTLKQYVGREAILGIRPEHVRLAASGQPGLPGGTIQSVETLGDTRLVEVEFDGGSEMPKAVRLVAKTQGESEAVAGRSVAIQFDVERAAWFDAQTGVNLGLERTQEGN